MSDNPHSESLLPASHRAALRTRCGGRGMPGAHPKASGNARRGPFRTSQDHAGGSKRRGRAAGGGGAASGSPRPPRFCKSLDMIRSDGNQARAGSARARRGRCGRASDGRAGRGRRRGGRHRRGIGGLRGDHGERATGGGRRTTRRGSRWAWWRGEEKTCSLDWNRGGPFEQGSVHAVFERVFADDGLDAQEGNGLFVHPDDEVRFARSGGEVS